MNGWSSPNRASGMKEINHKTFIFSFEVVVHPLLYLLLHDFFIFGTLRGSRSSVPEKNQTAEVVLGIVSGHNIC